MLFVGYFENIDSQRGIAWRCADSLSLRAFLGVPLHEYTPDHSTLTKTRKRLPPEVFEEVFQFVLGIAEAKSLIAGKTVGVDSTTLEANAAMKSIVRRDTGEDWQAFVTRLMREEGVIGPNDTPTDEEIRRFDKDRKDKKVSNAEWVSTTDPEAKITRMKGRHDALGVQGPSTWSISKATWCWRAEIRRRTTPTAPRWWTASRRHRSIWQRRGSAAEIEEAAADKGYHAAETIELGRGDEGEDLHPRAEAAAQIEVGRQGAGVGERGGQQQSPAGAAGQRQSDAAASQ